MSESKQVAIIVALAVLTVALLSCRAHAGEADVKLNLCLRQQAAIGRYFGGSYDPKDVGALVSLIKECPLRWTDFTNRCHAAGGSEGECNLQGMMMALDAAEEFKR